MAAKSTRLVPDLGLLLDPPVFHNQEGVQEGEQLQLLRALSAACAVLRASCMLSHLSLRAARAVWTVVNPRSVDGKWRLGEC